MFVKSGRELIEICKNQDYKFEKLTNNTQPIQFKG